MGIEDEFNICNGSDEEVVEMCRQIYHEDSLLKIRQCAERYPMSRAVHNAFYGYIMTFSYSSMMHYLAPILNLDIRLYPLTTFTEWFEYQLFKLTMKKLYKYSWFIKLSNRHARNSTKNARKKRKNIVKKLQKQFPDQNFTLETYPFILDLNNNNKF